MQIAPLTIYLFHNKNWSNTNYKKLQDTGQFTDIKVYGALTCHENTAEQNE